MVPNPSWCEIRAREDEKEASLSNVTESGTVLRDGAFGNATGLVCRECGATQELGPYYACMECFGPLEIAYDFPAITREECRSNARVAGTGTSAGGGSGTAKALLDALSGMPKGISRPGVTSGCQGDRKKA